MGSPPPNNLQGASRVTGGVIRGHALGNVFNLADSCDLEVPISTVMGKLYLYDSRVDPSTTKPNSAIKLKVTTSLHTVLLKLGEKHSPVHRKLAYYQLAIYF